MCDWKKHYLIVYILVLWFGVHQLSGLQHFLAGVRSYRNYVIDQSNGFLRRIAPVSLTVEPVELSPLPMPENQTGDGTLLQAVPYSLDQLIRAYGHALLDHSWNIHEIAPVVHLNMLWPGETSRPISLPCWAPAQPVPIRLNQTTYRSHSRTWYIGQGNTLSLSMASAFGYKTEPSSGALQVTPFMGLRYDHSVFTCALSRETPSSKAPRPKVSFAQTHMIYFQTTDPSVNMEKSKVRVTADLDFRAYAFDSDSPACNNHPRYEGQTVCTESPWMNIDPIEQNTVERGYRMFRHPNLRFDPIPNLLTSINETVRDFCRIYSCVITVGPAVRPFYKEKDTDDAQQEAKTFVEFYRDWIVLQGTRTAQKMTPLSKKWKSGNVRVTHNLPGNEVLNISVTIRFTNELVDCNMVYQMIEPDMGDLQQTAHHFSLENEPAAPLSKMLQPHEMTWFRTRERTDAEKYRPTMCLSQGPRDRASFGDLSDEAILPFDGFTAVFVVPKVDESSTLVEFNLEEGACELQVLCKNKICTFSLSLSHNPLYELPIHEIPAGGVHEFMERGRQFTSNVFILVAHPVRRSGDVWKQFLSVYRNMHRVTDGDAEIDSELLSRRCGGNSTSTAMEKEGSMIKLLNWPEYELSGPSVVRAEAAYKQLIKECNESYTGIPYNASAQPYLSEIYPNNAVRMHYALSGLPCSGPCRSGYDKSYSAHMMCYTTRKREPCTKEFFTIISREIYDMTRDSNSPLYSAFAIQYCKSEFLRINELGASQIASQEARSCNISGNIRSLSRVIKCEQDRPLEELKDKFDLNQCMLVKKDENHRHRLALDAVKLRLKPVIRSCRPHPDVAPLYQSYKRENFRVYMRTHNDRKCPIGYRKEKSVDNFTCTRCPADSYADINTELNTCQGCPMTRPSTFFADSASSTQCSNEQLNQIRGMFFRYDTANYTDEEWESGFDFTTPQWWNFPYNKFESLEHLKPNESYLENQRQAISAFLAMTQLTFSDGEVFLLLVISTSLAVYGGVISMLILAATSIPRPCPAIGFYGPDPSFKERIGLAIYCQLAKIGLMIFSIWKRIIARVTYETKRARQSMVSQRLSRVTSTAGKRMSSLLRRQWDKNRLPPLTDRQKALIRLVSETTINRIVEFAERELAERRQRRELIREEQHRRRQEVGEIEAEAADIEAMAAVAQREAKEAEQYVADAKDGKSRLLALQAAEEAKQRAESLTSRASRMRMSASQRLTEILEFDLEEELIPIHKRRLSIEDEHAIQNAAPELRAFLRLPRHHTAAYFLLHPDIHQDELLRKTAFPAPERDWKRT